MGYSSGAIHCEYKVIRMVLAQAVVDGMIGTSPAEHVRLPPPRRQGKATYYGAAVPDQGANALGAEYRTSSDAAFLIAEQVEYLIEATPWPYHVLVCVAVWTGLRSGELAGLQVGDVDLGRNPRRSPSIGTSISRTTAPHTRCRRAADPGDGCR